MVFILPEWKGHRWTLHIAPMCIGLKLDLCMEFWNNYTEMFLLQFLHKGKTNANLCLIMYKNTNMCTMYLIQCISYIHDIIYLVVCWWDLQTILSSVVYIPVFPFLAGGGIKKSGKKWHPVPTSLFNIRMIDVEKCS